MYTLQTPGPSQSCHTNHTEKRSASTETDPHQQSPEYIQYKPETRTHGEQAPPHINAHWPAVDRDTQKQHTPINAEGPNPLASPQLHTGQHTKPTTSRSPPQQS